MVRPGQSSNIEVMPSEIVLWGVHLEWRCQEGLGSPNQSKLNLRLAISEVKEVVTEDDKLVGGVLDSSDHSNLGVTLNVGVSKDDVPGGVILNKEDKSILRMPVTHVNALVTKHPSLSEQIDDDHGVACPSDHSSVVRPLCQDGDTEVELVIRNEVFRGKGTKVFITLKECSC